MLEFEDYMRMIAQQQGLDIDDLAELTRILKQTRRDLKPLFKGKNFPEVGFARWARTQEEREYILGESKAVIKAADEAATSLNHNYIGTEHILIGIAKVRPDLLLGENPQENLAGKIKGAVEDIIGKGEKRLPFEKGLTPKATSAISRAVDFAIREGVSQVSPKHLLKGIMTDGNSIAFGVLESLDMVRPISKSLGL